MASHPLSWISQLALPKLTLLLNHIVSSEPVAAAKLQPHAGRTVDIRWVSQFSPALPDFLKRSSLGGSDSPAPWRFTITPAGLFEAAETSSNPHGDASASVGNGLIITVHLPDPLTMAKLVLKGERPEVNIEGDAALAEVAAWLMKNLRWDVQDDVARWLGTAPAEVLRSVGTSIKLSLQRWRPGASGQPGTRAGQR